MAEASLKGKVARGAFWALLEQLSGQIVNFALGIVLARLLTPEDYGTVALVTIFITIGTVLVSSGFGQALVQKKDADNIDFGSVFYMSVAVAVVLVVALFFAAPLIAAFYKTDKLTAIVRILSLNLVFYALCSVMNAELYREMRFNATFRISLWTALASAAIGITLAVMGYGVWALVWSSLGSNLVGVAVRFWYVRWRPDLSFNWARLKPLWHYGWRVAAKQLLGTVFANLYGFLTGKFYTRSDLAFVNKGRNIPELLANNLSAALFESSFPALSKMQDDGPRLHEATRRLLIVCSLVVFPVMAFLAVVSPRLIALLYGEKWMGCVPFMQLTCVYLALFPLSGLCNLRILAKGRSDVSLWLDIGSTVLAVLVLATCLPQGVLFWYAANCMVSLAYLFLVYCPLCCRVSGCSFLALLRDAIPAAVVAGLAAAATWLVGFLWWRGRALPLDVACLLVQTALAGGLVLAVSWMFRLEAVREILMMLQTRLPAENPICAVVFRRFGIQGGKSDGLAE